MRSARCGRRGGGVGRAPSRRETGTGREAAWTRGGQERAHAPSSVGGARAPRRRPARGTRGTTRGTGAGAPPPPARPERCDGPTVTLLNHWGEASPGALAENVAAAQHDGPRTCARTSSSAARPRARLRAPFAHEREPRSTGRPPRPRRRRPTPSSPDARAAGYRTHLIGAHGLLAPTAPKPARRAPRRGRAFSPGAARPRRVGYLIASPRTTARASAAAPPRTTRRRCARRGGCPAARREGDPPLLLWVNLLACRDLQRVPSLVVRGAPARGARAPRAAARGARPPPASLSEGTASPPRPDAAPRARRRAADGDARSRRRRRPAAARAYSRG